MSYEQKIKQIFLAALVIINVAYFFVVKFVFGILIKPEPGKATPVWIIWTSLITVIILLSVLTYVLTQNYRKQKAAR